MNSTRSRQRYGPVSGPDRHLESFVQPPVHGIAWGRLRLLRKKKLVTPALAAAGRVDLLRQPPPGAARR